MKMFLRLSMTTIVLSVFFNVPAVTEIKAQSVINEILKRVDAHQKSLSSLRSKVTMTRYNSQLQETDVSEGTTIYMRTNGNQVSARIDWTKPAQESLTLTNGQYILYRPHLRQAIVGKIDNTNENAKIFNALSFLNMSRNDIKANYLIKYNGEEKVKGNNAWHLMFTPRKTDIYKSAQLWIDGNGMPIQAKVFQSNNDSTTVLLSDFKKNETINIRVFILNLPKGTKIIRTSIAACPCFKPDNANDSLRYWSDAVFSGKVTAVSGADYTIITEKMWKGVIGSKVIVRNFSTDGNCGAKLVAGERYLVFARKVEVEGKTILGLMPCNFTSKIVSDSGKKILKEIGNGKLLKKMTDRKRGLPAKTFKKRR